MNKVAAEILVVEDDLADVKILARGLKKVRPDYGIVHKKSCEDALQYLNEQELKSPPARPLLVLLDINLPGMNGIEFLGKLRDMPGANSNYVIAFTTSKYQKDIDAAYAAGAKAYVLKPTYANDLHSTLSAIFGYLDIVQMPSMES